MWIFTRYGFFSVTASEKDEAKVKVRARSAEHLRNLQKVFPEVLANEEIVIMPNTDYAARIFLDRNKWVKIATTLAKEIDYSNFKDEVHDFAERTGWDKGEADDYLNTLYQVWSAGRTGLQT